MINYTVIIPHYNIPDLLRRCLKSIPCREDVQVVVVDDRSSDENLIILKEMERGFSNVQFVYLEKNQGGGNARNVGLQYAIGTYVFFADADDFFHECINDVFDEYKDETCDVVYFSATLLIQKRIRLWTGQIVCANKWNDVCEITTN